MSQQLTKHKTLTCLSSLLTLFWMTQTFTQVSWINYQYIKLHPTLHIIRAMKSNQFQIILKLISSISIFLFFLKGVHGLNFNIPSLRITLQVHKIQRNSKSKIPLTHTSIIHSMNDYDYFLQPWALIIRLHPSSGHYTVICLK